MLYDLLLKIPLLVVTGFVAVMENSVTELVPVTVLILDACILTIENEVLLREFL